MSSSFAEDKKSPHSVILIAEENDAGYNYDEIQNGKHLLGNYSACATPKGCHLFLATVVNRGTGIFTVHAMFQNAPHSAITKSMTAMARCCDLDDQDQVEACLASFDPRSG